MHVPSALTDHILTADAAPSKLHFIYISVYSGTPVWYNNSSKVTAELKAHYSLYELLFIVFIVFMNS